MGLMPQARTCTSTCCGPGTFGPGAEAFIIIGEAAGPYTTARMADGNAIWELGGKREIQGCLRGRKRPLPGGLTHREHVACTPAAPGRVPADPARSCAWFTAPDMARWEQGDPRWIVSDRADGHNVNGWHWVRASPVSPTHGGQGVASGLPFQKGATPRYGALPSAASLCVSAVCISAHLVPGGPGAV